ncbi:MAG: HPr family phosphocarrier protein [Actinomycetota bacterium]|nr:HPr family phosphocarrier protein [Actinomycetota bacterium]
MALSKEEPVVERSVTVPPGVGLHARPVSLLVQAAAGASSSVTVARPGGDPVNAKSILALLGLDVRGGERVVLRADGPEAEETLDRIARVVTAMPPVDG